MYILGINGGHNGTAALLKDGKIIGCVSEERFSRIKNHVGFPYKSIEYLLQTENITYENVDYLILVKNIGMDVKEKGESFNSFMFNYSNKSLVQKMFGCLTYKYPSFFNPLIRLRYKFFGLKKQKRLEVDNIEKISKKFNINQEKIIYVDHHLTHALAACFNLPQNEKSLIFTLDGEGPSNERSLCATVSIFDGKKIKRIAETEKGASLGYLYGITTLYLGMKPNEHEFKVMGLAPYAKKDYVDSVYPLFKNILWIEGLKFKSKFRMQYADFYLNKFAKYKRFDNISGAIQRLTEELTVRWIKTAIKNTGINRIALSGGVFMNVKANQKISELPEVRDIFPVPSCGDECTALGACFFGYAKYCKENNIELKPKPLKNLYLGPEYSDEEIQKFIQDTRIDKKYEIKKVTDIEKEIAKLLAQGEVVARLKGRSEWGARALGNRSLLANPCNKDIVMVLNELIKDRDFWMPFTPSILEESLNDYIINKKKIFCPYMIITFDSTEKARKEIIAAIHPYDFTVRPQSVIKSWNPDYYRLIKEFKKGSGIGAVLNTSFNLHGEPNVLSPRDAIHTLENSGLKYLALGSYLIKKKMP